MRILMLTCQFMPDVFGGAEKQCLRQARALAARGHGVTIVTTRASLRTPAREDMDGVGVVRHWVPRPPDLLGRWLPFTFWWLGRLLVFGMAQRGRFDVVHCHQGKFGLFAGAVLARLWRVPQVVKVGNSGAHMDLAALARKRVFGPIFLRAALRGRPVFVAISDMIRRDLLAFGVAETHIQTIVNGIVPVAASFKEPAETLAFFWHGRFEPIKNLTLLLEAFALALQDDPRLALVLVGSGSEEAALRQRAKALTVADKVRFVPPPQDVLAEIATYDVFANTSHAEGMSNAMLEAMALGKALVSTPVSGTDEIIDNGRNGFVAAGHSAAAVAQAMLRAAALYRQNPRAVFDHGLKKAGGDFAMARVAERYEALYAALLPRQTMR